jgi:pyruvate formate lyase activating enzyme
MCDLVLFIGIRGAFFAKTKKTMKSMKRTIYLNDESVKVPSGITVKEALQFSGYRVTKFPEKEALFVPCEVGGCWSCAVLIDGEPKPACKTLVRDGQHIKTPLPENHEPKRIIHGFTGHPVGGVGTPWKLKRVHTYIEVACFAAGCNFRCPQCQNWDITYNGKSRPMTPYEASERLTAARKKFGVDRMAISGGECTLNRMWLIRYVRSLKRLNPDADARIHIDTNGSILTTDYIDELIDAGMTDIGIDLKGCTAETFSRITAVKDAVLAKRYLSTAWKAVRYLIESCKDKVFTGVGIPYNAKLISLDEVGLIGKKLYQIDPRIQVCALDYRPEFKRFDLQKPSYEEMLEVHKVLKDAGLKTVICQTHRGHIGP